MAATYGVPWEPQHSQENTEEMVADRVKIVPSAKNGQFTPLTEIQNPTQDRLSYQAVTLQ